MDTTASSTASDAGREELDSRKGSIINWLRSPISGLTGKLSFRQKQDAQEAKAARLAAADEVDTGPPPHVLEGHADRSDPLGWGTRVCAKADEEQRKAREDLMRWRSPLRKRTQKDYDAAYKKENLEARRESELLVEETMKQARERRERLRLEEQRALKNWTPRDVTPKKKHDSGVGELADEEKTKMKEEDKEEARQDAEMVKEDLRLEAERIAQNDNIHGDETPRTANARERAASTVGMSRADMEAVNNDIKGVADTPDIQQLKDLKHHSLDNPNIQQLTSTVDAEAKDLNSAAQRTPEIPAIEDMPPKEKEKAEEHIIQAIGRMQDIQVAMDKTNTTEGNHPRRAKLVRGESEKLVDGVVEAKVPVHPSMPEQNPDGTAVESHAETAKAGSIVTSLGDGREDAKISAQGVKASPTSTVQNPNFGKGTDGEAARTFDDISPTSGAKEVATANSEVKDVAQTENNTTNENAPSAASRKVHKWAKGKEGEEARRDGGVSPKSVRVGSAVMSLDELGYGDSVEGKDEGYFGVKQSEEEVDREELGKAESEKRTSEWVHRKDEDGEKEGNGKEGQPKEGGEEARMEGGVSPKSARVGSVVMSAGGERYATTSENGSMSMKSAKSRVEEP